jgi:hypothetical protein
MAILHADLSSSQDATFACEHCRTCKSVSSLCSRLERPSCTCGHHATHGRDRYHLVTAHRSDVPRSHASTFEAAGRCSVGRSPDKCWMDPDA